MYLDRLCSIQRWNLLPQKFVIGVHGTRCRNWYYFRVPVFGASGVAVCMLAVNDFIILENRDNSLVLMLLSLPLLAMSPVRMRCVDQ